MSTWLFTNTTYCTWLPGDARGSVTRVRDHRIDDIPSESRITHNSSGTPLENPSPKLEQSSRHVMKGPPVFFDAEKATILVTQFCETAKHRNWSLRCMSAMWNHVHWIASIPEELNPAKALADFKAYGSRALNHRFGKPPSNTWWTSKGSNRLLKDEAAVSAAMNYVLYLQPNPLVTWHSDSE